MDVETLCRQNFFDVNISFKKEKKQERENFIIAEINEKFPPDNDDLYIEYNPEENSYQILIDNERKEKEDLLEGLETINKKIKETKDKKKKRTKTNKKTYIQLLQNKYGEIELAGYLRLQKRMEK